jgi:hypothetical protein
MGKKQSPSRAVETVTSTEEDIRLRIYDGDLTVVEGAGAMLAEEVRRREQAEAMNRRLLMENAVLSGALARQHFCPHVSWWSRLGRALGRRALRPE